MTLTHDRPEARSLDGAKAIADPQSRAVKHLFSTAKRAPVARPVNAMARSFWSEVRGS